MKRIKQYISKWISKHIIGPEPQANQVSRLDMLEVRRWYQAGGTNHGH